MDLATIQLSDGSSSYMALLANWGVVADIDIESEKFRKIGKTRFLLGMYSMYISNTKCPTPLHTACCSRFYCTCPE